MPRSPSKTESEPNRSVNHDVPDGNVAVKPRRLQAGRAPPTPAFPLMLRRVILLLALPVAAAALLRSSFARRYPRVCATEGVAEPPLAATTVRLLERHEIDEVATLQLDAFMPMPEPPALLPMFASLFVANQERLRAGLRMRLIDEIERRMLRGSSYLVVEAPTGAASRGPVGRLAADGTYSEGSGAAPLIGTLEISIHEIELPTHGLCGGVYLSHVVVDEMHRRQGVARQLLAAAEKQVALQGISDIYLHVEAVNLGAIALYENCGYERKPDASPFVGFTRALQLEHRDPVLMHRELRATV